MHRLATMLCAVAMLGWIVGCGDDNEGRDATLLVPDSSTRTATPLQSETFVPFATPTPLARRTPTRGSAATATPTPSGLPATPTAVAAARIVLEGTFVSGQTSVVRATLFSEVPVAGTQNDIRFAGSAVRVVANARGEPDCSVNPAIDKNGTAFGFLPGGCDPATDCEAVRAFVLAVDNADPIPSGSLLYQCNVAVELDAPAETSLLCEKPGAATPSGGAVRTDCDGVIVVPGRTSTPRPTATRTPMTTPPRAQIILTGAFVPGQTNAVRAILLSPVPVAGTQNDIGFDVAAARVVADASGRPDCTVNPAIDKDATGFNFLPNGCDPAIDCQAVRAVVISIENVDAIPSGSLLYECNVAVEPDAPPGTGLRCEEAGAAGLEGEAIPTGCNDIVVGPTPTPTEVRTPQAALQVSRVEGSPGETVPLEVRLSSVDAGVEVAALQTDLLLPPAVQVSATAAGDPDCRVNPEIDKPDTVYGFLDAGRTVRVFVLSFAANFLESIPVSSLLFTCDATISLDALPGELLPIGCRMTLGSTASGEEIPMSCEPGEITVRAD